MKKGTVLLFLLLLVTASTFAQQKIIDSLKLELGKTGEDTNRVLLLDALAINAYQFRPDTAILAAQQAYDLSQKLHYPKGMALSLNRIAAGHNTLGDYAKSLRLVEKALQISQKNNDWDGISRGYNNIGDNYSIQKDYKRALDYFKKAELVGQQHPEIGSYADAVVSLNIGDCFLWLHQYDSADVYLRATYEKVLKEKYEDTYGNLERDLGLVETARKNYSAALAYFRKAVESCLSVDNIQYLSTTYSSIADFYKEQGQRDSAIAYTEKALQAAQACSYNLGIFEASKNLSDYYAGNNDKEAFRYLSLATAARDSLFSQEKVKQLLSFSFEEKQREQELEAARQQSRNQLRLFALLGILAVFLLLAILLYRNNRNKQKANRLLQQQKKEIETALTNLKAAQNQLVQSEKMASLGELTAGIAHEIQNPLNFINNFSETNKELITELKEEATRGNIQEVLAIALDIENNEEKINHHGRRADSIVKSMLEHSRSSKGEKQLVKLNLLTDEYLRLSYHGMRAKDKAFNADIKTHFDESIGKVNIIPQEIGRVLLNLFNNAFYAVNEKKRQLNGTFDPTVTVSTAKQNGSIVLRVADNGNGIPQQVLDKIFQPFFTTKPTGQGTGLGLSLSYDIVKAHGGELKVESEEGKGSVFIVIIPA